MSIGPSGVPVRILSMDAVVGMNSVNWDGRDQSGKKVSGNAYLFVIEASDDSHSGFYDATDLALADAATFSPINAQCDAIKNIFASFKVIAPQPGLAGIQLTTPNGTIYPFGVNGKPIPAGTTILYWDCRDPLTGELASFPATQLSAFTRFPPNTLLVDGAGEATIIKGAGASVEVKSNPYIVYLSYGQFTKIAYHLDFVDADMTLVDIRLLPPNVLNFDDPSAINVFSGEQAAGDHEVTWQGTVGTANSAKRNIGSVEGAYTFAIKTTTNGVSSLYRGTLSVYQ